MAQTAVEFLLQKFTERLGNLWLEDFEQAKQKEKEQMHKCASFWRGKEGEIEMPIFNQYYNDTYGTANK